MKYCFREAIVALLIVSCCLVNLSACSNPKDDTGIMLDVVSKGETTTAGETVTTINTTTNAAANSALTTATVPTSPPMTTAAVIEATTKQSTTQSLSPWVLKSSVPAGVQIVTYKWVYTQRATATSSSSSMSGWTAYKEPTWVWSDYGAWSDWQKTQPIETEARDVDAPKVIPAVTKKIYMYFQYSKGIYSYNYPEPGYTFYYIYRDVEPTPGTRSGIGGGDVPYWTFSSGIPSQATRWYPGDGEGPIEWYEKIERTEVVTPAYTEWRYRDRSRIYTYYFEKLEKDKETEPTANHIEFPYTETLTITFIDRKEYVRYQ